MQGGQDTIVENSGSRKRPRKRSRKSRTQAAAAGSSEDHDKTHAGGEVEDAGSEKKAAVKPAATATASAGKHVESEAVKAHASASAASAGKQVGPKAVKAPASASTERPAAAFAGKRVQPKAVKAPASASMKPSDQSAEAGPSILASNPHKPSVLPRPSIYGARRYTLSVALPSSILSNVPTMELKTRLVGSIARICAVFNVDEIVVFDDGTEKPAANQWRRDSGGAGPSGRKREWNEDGGDGAEEPEQSHSQSHSSAQADPFDASSFMAMILQYLETPQYLRKQLFPMHPNLRLAGLLPPLDCPHHLRFEEESPYREGIVVEEPHWAARAGQGQDGQTVWVNTGSRDPTQCKVSGDQWPEVGARVTVEMPAGAGHSGALVSPRTPVQTRGLYWGYSVRLCSSLSQVFAQGPFPSTEYDLVLGTSERGDSLTDVLHATLTNQKDLPSSKSSSVHPTVSPLPNAYKHALILFGGLSGLEVAIEKDREIPLGLADAHELCDFWIDCVEGQGSRTVRTEEAITITLARLKTTLEQLGSR